MTRTLKILGIPLIAALATTLPVASSGSANPTAHTGGHFTQDSGGIATLHGEDEGPHHFYLGGPSIFCDATYASQMTSATATSITITPQYTECVINTESATAKLNGCNYTFTVRDTDASTKKSPLHFKCPAGKKMEVIWPNNCAYTLGEQQVTEAVIYRTITVNGKNALTVELDAGMMSYEKHGPCWFHGQAGTGPFAGTSFKGSTILTAKNGAGEPVNFTATGRNGH